jgi:hypothetical protein
MTFLELAFGKLLEKKKAKNKVGNPVLAVRDLIQI